MKRMLMLVTSICWVLDPRPAAAQAEEPAVLFVPGIVFQQAVFGDDAPRGNEGPSATIGVQARRGRTGRTALVFEATLHTNPLENPHFREFFMPFAALLGAQIGRRVYVRPSGGVAIQGGGPAPVFGVAVGFDRRVGAKWIVAPEFVVRGSGVAGLAGWVAGVQVPVGVRIN